MTIYAAHGEVDPALRSSEWVAWGQTKENVNLTVANYTATLCTLAKIYDSATSRCGTPPGRPSSWSGPVGGRGPPKGRRLHVGLRP